MRLLDFDDVDVVVAGGGPAGCTVAILVAMRGHRVVLLERERFPRYQIGESLLPSTILGVCGLLGVRERVDAAGFVVKRGGTFRWGAKPEPWTFTFTDALPMDESTAVAYQVERMKFDQILLDRAREVGVDVRECCTARDVIAGPERVRGIGYTDPAGHERQVRARYVVDASGNTSRIHRQAGGNRMYSDFFRNIALFAYFEGGKRLPPPNSGNVMSVAFASGWFWYIPLSAQLTSVGAVVRGELSAKIQGDSETALRDLIGECPLISEFLDGARRVTSGVYGEVRARKDYSYSASRFWRPGMVLVGDAACFIDPVLSTGVHLATYSGLLAARSLNSVLAGKISESRAFGEFEARYRREYATFYEFLVSFYDTNVDETSYFWTAKKVTCHPAAELEAFLRLVGGVASGEGALLGASTGCDPRPVARVPEPAPADWDADRHIRFDPFYAEGMGGRHWIPGSPPAGRLGPASLVPSPDGLQWTPVSPGLRAHRAR